MKRILDFCIEVEVELILDTKHKLIIAIFCLLIFKSILFILYDECDDRQVYVFFPMLHS